MDKKKALLASAGGLSLTLVSAALTAQPPGVLPDSSGCGGNTACVIELQSSRAAVADMLANGYQVVAGPEVQRDCGQLAGVDFCMDLSAAVLYNAQFDAAVLVCAAQSPASVSVTLRCGDMPGVAMVSTATAVAPWLPGQLSEALVSAQARAAYDAYSPLQASFSIRW